MVSALVARARSSLYGVAVGDAFGKMTEGYWPSQVIERYGKEVDSFCHPIQPTSKYEWGLAEVTDDTRFTLLVAESIVSCGAVNEQDIVARILEAPIKGWPGWDRFRLLADQGLKDDRTGNGAPMRVAPVGIIHSTAISRQTPSPL